MLTVEIMSHHGTIVLRARNSELLILPQHVVAMKDLKDPRQFSEYFLKEALVNRPARKLFEAWLRKDRSVWPRIFKTVQTTEIPDEIMSEIEKLNQPSPADEISEPEKDIKSEQTITDMPDEASEKKTKKDSGAKKKTTKKSTKSKKTTTKKSTTAKKVTKKATEKKTKTKTTATKKATKTKTKSKAKKTSKKA